VSADKREKNRRFAQSLGLNFPVLSDGSSQVTRAYGIQMPVVGLPKRVTFIIDRNGVIQNILRGREALDPSFAHRSLTPGAA
jgi:peroxiredoxin Q/BCP